VFEIMQAIVDDRYFKNTFIMHPGIVGSVGDALVSVRLKQSAPDMKMRYDKAFSGKNEMKSGSNVQDGDTKSYSSKGESARVYDSNWQNKKFKTSHGWIYQDLRAPDKTLTEVMGSTGRYDWYNRVANTYQAKITGDMFLPLPNGYQPSGIPRGGQVPRIVATDEPMLPNLNDDSFYDQRKKPKENANGVISAIVCTDPRTGKMTYKVVPGKAPQGNQAPPSTASPPTATTATPTTTQTPNSSQPSPPDPDLSNVRFGP
jgi:hypothetical protein